MKQVLMAVAALSAALVGLEVDAKRLGGGRTVGAPRDVATQRQMTPPAQNVAPAPTTPTGPTAAAAPAAAAKGPLNTPPAAAQPGWKRFMGPIAGIAAGLGIAALMSHLGLGEAFGNFLMIALLVIAAVVVVKLILRRRTPAADANRGLQYASAGAGTGSGGSTGPAGTAGFGGATGSAGSTGFGGGSSSGGSFGGSSGSPMSPGAGAAVAGVAVAGAAVAGAAVAGAAVAGATATAGAIGAAGAVGAQTYPAGFEPEPFLQQAKVNFARLQTAYDHGDSEMLRDVMTPEMFTEVSGDLAARGTHQSTDIVRLNAEILEVITDNDHHWATVRFHGLTREDGVDAPQSFDEAWNLRKAVDGSTGWLLAGIQQLQ